MDLQLKDKIIIVTGGAKGIGEGIVKALAKEDAFPVIIGRSQEDNLATVEAIKAEGGKAAQVVAELSVAQLCEWFEARDIFPMGLYGRWKYMWSDAAWREGRRAAGQIAARFSTPCAA